MGVGCQADRRHFVLVQVEFVTYIMTDQKTEKGELLPDKKVSRSYHCMFRCHAPTRVSQIYHILVDKLRILDHGDGEIWYPPVPTMPERRFNPSPASLQKRVVATFVTLLLRLNLRSFVTLMESSETSSL
jgi:hypothetical protein